jgi:hypothetical protein
MSNLSIDKGTIIKSGESLYQVIADFTEVDTEIDYEMEQIFPQDRDNITTTTKSELLDKMQRGKVKIVKNE